MSARHVHVDGSIESDAPMLQAHLLEDHHLPAGWLVPMPPGAATDRPLPAHIHQLLHVPDPPGVVTFSFDVPEGASIRVETWAMQLGSTTIRVRREPTGNFTVYSDADAGHALATFDTPGEANRAASVLLKAKARRAELIAEGHMLEQAALQEIRR